MAEIIKETVVNKGNTTTPVVNTTIKSVKNEASKSQTIEYIIYFLFGLLEILLAFRLVLKLTGANPVSGFVSFIYGLTQIFVLPFLGIFRQTTTQGLETTAVLEPATLVAAVVYGVLAWGIVMLVRIFSGEKQETE